MNLTDEEIRIKVAEAMGYERRPCEWQNFIAWHDPSGKYLPPIEHVKRLDRQALHVPNYPEDLNACAQFEDELKKLGVFSSYLSNLALVCGFNAQGDEAWLKLHAGLEAVCSATARQRCIAYLKTKGLIP